MCCCCCCRPAGCPPPSLGAVLSCLLTPPAPEAVAEAVGQLQQLGALQPGDEALTALGTHLAAMPMDAALGKALLYGCMLRWVVGQAGGQQRASNWCQQQCWVACPWIEDSIPLLPPVPAFTTFQQGLLLKQHLTRLDLTRASPCALCALPSPCLP